MLPQPSVVQNDLFDLYVQLQWPYTGTVVELWRAATETDPGESLGDCGEPINGVMSSADYAPDVGVWWYWIVDADGSGPRASIDVVYVPLVLTAPEAPTVVSTDQVTLTTQFTWPATPEVLGDGRTGGFLLWRADTADGAGQQVGGALALTIEDTAPSAGTWWYWLITSKGSYRSDPGPRTIVVLAAPVSASQPSSLFGDAEAAACDIIRANTRVRTFDGVTVATDLTGFTSPARRVKVTRIGGVPVMWMRMDNAVIEFEALAESKAVAYDLAAAARAAVYAARGRYFGNGLALYDVLDDPGGGLVFSPDPKDPAVCRYVFKLVLVTQPSAVVIPVGSGPGIPPPVDDPTPENFIHHQGTPATVWQVSHSLGFDPAGVTVIDSDGYIRDGFGVQYTVSGQILRLSFDISLAGVAYLS